MIKFIDDGTRKSEPNFYLSKYFHGSQSRATKFNSRHARIVVLMHTHTTLLHTTCIPAGQPQVKLIIITHKVQGWESPQHPRISTSVQQSSGSKDQDIIPHYHSNALTDYVTSSHSRVGRGINNVITNISVNSFPHRLFPCSPTSSFRRLCTRSAAAETSCQNSVSIGPPNNHNTTRINLPEWRCPLAPSPG